MGTSGRIAGSFPDNYMKLAAGFPRLYFALPSFWWDAACADAGESGLDLADLVAYLKTLK